MELEEHGAVALEDLVGELDDEAVGDDEVAEGFDVEEVVHLLAEQAVLAEDGIGYCSRAGDARAAMHEDSSPGGKLTGKVENAFHVPRKWAIRIAGIAGVLEKTKEQLGTRCDRLDLFSTSRVVEEGLVPNRNNVRPPFTLLLW